MVFEHFIPNGIKIIIKSLGVLIFKHGYIICYLMGIKETILGIIYFTYHSVRSVVFYITSAISVGVFILFLSYQPAQLLNVGSYFSVLAILLSLYVFVNMYNYLRIADKTVISKIFVSANETSEK